MACDMHPTWGKSYVDFFQCFSHKETFVTCHVRSKIKILLFLRCPEHFCPVSECEFELKSERFATWPVTQHRHQHMIKMHYKCIEMHFFLKTYWICFPVLLCAYGCYYTQKLTKIQHQITLKGHDLLTALTMKRNTIETSTTCRQTIHAHVSAHTHLYTYHIYVELYCL